MSEIWACEYSPTQGCFHVDTLERVLEANREMALTGKCAGYMPLGIFTSCDAAHDFAESWKKKVCVKEEVSRESFAHEF